MARQEWEGQDRGGKARQDRIPTGHKQQSMDEGTLGKEPRTAVAFDTRGWCRSRGRFPTPAPRSPKDLKRRYMSEVVGSNLEARMEAQVC